MNLGGLTIGWREALVGLIALIALYMFVMVWRMRRLQQKAAKAPPPPPDDTPPPPTPEELAWQIARDRLAAEAIFRGLTEEMKQVRSEVDALRGEVAALRTEFSQQLGQMKATQLASPLYSDAMQMAQKGHDPSLISERCGISRAEAELVVALVKSQNG